MTVLTRIAEWSTDGHMVREKNLPSRTRLMMARGMPRLEAQ
jgi:hypothetical protein